MRNECIQGGRLIAALEVGLQGLRIERHCKAALMKHVVPAFSSPGADRLWRMERHKSS